MAQSASSSGYNGITSYASGQAVSGKAGVSVWLIGLIALAVVLIVWLFKRK